MSAISGFSPTLMPEASKILSIALEENVGQIIVNNFKCDDELIVNKIQRALDMLLADAAIEILITAFSEALNLDIQHYSINNSNNNNQFHSPIVEEKPKLDIYDKTTNDDQNVQNIFHIGGISHDEFVEKLKRCFLPLYSDAYLLLAVTVADDPMIKTEWLDETIKTAKDQYASDIEDLEHIFLLKQSMKGDLVLAISKSKIKMEQELRCGFILTDKFLYIDAQGTPLKISISNILSFDILYESSNKQYVLSFVYKSQNSNVKRYLIRSDSKICTLKDSLNLFLEKHKKYSSKILSN